MHRPYWSFASFALLSLLAQSVGNVYAQEPSASTRVAFPKIELRLWELAKTREWLPVFIVLKFQPQREIVEKNERATRLQRNLAEERYRRLADWAVPDEKAIRSAQADLDRVILASRSVSAEQIEDAVRSALDRVDARLRAVSATDIRSYSLVTMLRADIPSGALTALASDPDIAEVALIEPQAIQIRDSVPGLGAPALWPSGNTGTGQSVAVLDTGVNASHPALAGRIANLPAFTARNLRNCISGDDPSSPADFNGHGTHIAGIIASQGSSGWSTYRGVAPGSTIYNFKVACNVSPFGLGIANPDDIIAAIDAMSRLTSIKIVNLSIGAPTTSDDSAFGRLLDYYAELAGLTIAVSAGNYEPGFFSLTDSGSAFNVISVANAASRTTVDPSSIRGPTLGGRRKPDIAAPGKEIYSAAHDWDGFFGLNPDFVPKTGTSMAAPHIAGAAALLRQRGVVDSKGIKALLINTTDTVRWTDGMGWGFANVARVAERADRVFLSEDSPRQTGMAVHLFKGSAPAGLVATLVWNRHVSGAGSTLNNLDLSLYDQDGNIIEASESRVDNVEQVYASSRLDYVLAVRGESSGTENFALAVSDRFAVPAIGPRLSVECSPPAAVSASSVLEIGCTIRNTGDLTVPGFTLIFTIGEQTTVDGITNVPGLLRPGESVVRRWTATAPSSPGTYQVRVAASFGAFGWSFLALQTGALYSGSLNVISSSLCSSLSLTPTGRLHTNSAAIGTIAIAANPGCVWTASVQEPWIGVSGSTSGSGPGQISYTLSSNGGPNRTGWITIGGQQFVITQTGPTSVAGGLRFVPVPPCRIMDTRNGSGLTGAFGPPVLSAGATREIPIPASACGIPSGAQAYSLNVTVIPDAGMLQFLTLWPAGQPRPNASTLNSFDGKIVANAALVPPGTNGGVSVFVTERSHVIIDINGYFAP